MKKIKISLDAMGGDNAPAIVVDGASEAKVRYPDIDFIFFGNKTMLDTHKDGAPTTLNCVFVVDFSIGFSRFYK